MKPIKQKKCKACGDLFTPYTTTAKACSPRCAIDLVERAKAKKARKELREGRERLKSRSDHLAEAQTDFNRYIAKGRDKDEPCISCGTTRQDIQYCAGHYLTRGGFPELRFDEDNVHKQCNKRCNLELSGNIAAYRINLVKKIGLERVEKLEGKHDPLKLSIEEIKELKLKYRQKLKGLA